MAWKNADTRLTETVAYLESLDKNATTLVQRRFERLAPDVAKKISEAMSLGSSVKALLSDKKKEEERRHAIRAVLLLYFAVDKQPPSAAASLITKFGGLALDKLNGEIKGHLPVMDDSPHRDAWDPKNFTDPKAFDNKKSFRFFVWSLMNAFTGRGVSYETILADPSIAKTFLLSTSIIDQDHRPTYYPYGIILKVPKNNVVSASSKDQAFKNYKVGTENMTKEEANDMLGEVRRVSALHGLDAPATILGGTRKAGGSTGYNEVVVLGTAPEGTSVEPVGIFVKVQDDGKTLYVRNQIGTDKPESKPYVTDKVQDLVDKLSKAKNLPIVRLIDTVK